MNEKIYVVTAVDTGDSCDGKARVLGAFRKRADAEAYVKSDMEEMCSRLAETNHYADWCHLAVMNEDEDTVSLWNIEETEVK